MEKNTDYLQQKAKELASLIISSQNEEKLADLFNHFFNEPIAEPENLVGSLFKMNETFEDLEKVGIWKLENIDEEMIYCRDINYYNEWHLWANVNEIPLESEKNRIILLGESVARGYFYDPYYNPAMALENILKFQKGYPDSEVIDLAKSSLTLMQLYEVFTSCIKLNPDGIVIFAGNNWLTALEEPVKNLLREKDIREIQADGLVKLKEILEQELEKLISQFIDFVSEVAELHDIKVVFVIPEFNLLDWKSTKSEQIIFQISEGNTFDWINAKIEAEKALSDARYEEAEVLARKMILFDETHPLGYEFLASCLIKKELFLDARSALETARDCALFYRSSSKPRIFSVIRKTIVDRAKMLPSIFIVDLPEVFSGEISDYIPDRELFLDYCHLTVKGIEISMRAVARQLVEDTLFSDAYPVIQPSEKVLAMAHLFAAIHNAHLGQPEDIIFYHCSQAVKEPTAQRFMSLYVDMASRCIESVLCHSFEEIILNGDLEQYQMGTKLLHGVGKKKMDFVLVQSMAKSMGSIGKPLQDFIDSLRVDEHALIDKKNLLQSYYSLDEYDSPIPWEVSYYQSRFPESNFVIIINEVVPIRLDLTFRVLKNETQPQTIDICVNGKLLDTLKVCCNWEQKEILIPVRYLNYGVNTVNIKWPVSSDSFDDVISSKIDCSSIALVFNSMYHIFGEIQRFTASVSKGDKVGY